MIRRQKRNEGIPFCVIFCDEIKMQKTKNKKTKFYQKVFFLHNIILWGIICGEKL
jgi:hypothetical protein